MGEGIGHAARASREPDATPPRRFARARAIRISAPSGAVFEATVAETLPARLLGLALLDRDAAPPLLIPRCRSVHSLWMRHPIDVVFLAMPPGLEGRAAVLDLRPALPPRRLAAISRKLVRQSQAAHVATLELPDGAVARLGIEPGAAVRLMRRSR